MNPRWDTTFVSATLVLLAASYSLVGCGRTVEPGLAVPVSVEFPLSKADCPVLPADPALQARMLIVTCGAAAQGDLDALAPRFDCDAGQFPQLLQTCTTLSVRTNATTGALSVEGECAQVPAKPVQLALQWFVVSPTLRKQVLIAEQVGPLDLTNSKTQVRIIEFKQPKTKGKSGDSETERNRFNCDRTGVSTCDSSAAPASQGGADSDTCSNLEELCLNPARLFNSQSLSDLCP